MIVIFNFNETHGFIILVDNLLYPSFKGYYEYNLLSKHTKIFSSAFYGFAQGNKGEYDFFGRKLMPLIYRPSPGKKEKENLKIMYIYHIC